MDLDVEKIIRCIREGNAGGVQTQLQEFNKEYAQCFFFDVEERDRRKFRKNKVRKYVESESDSDGYDEKDHSLILRQNLAAVLVRFIRAGVKSRLLKVCLVTLRILSRDKKVLGPLLSNSALLTLTRLAGLTSSDSAEEANDLESDNYGDIITALAEAKQAHNCDDHEGETEDDGEDEEDDECFTLDPGAKSDASNTNNGDTEGCGGCGSQPASVDDTHRGSINQRALERGRKDRRESKKDEEEEEGDEDRVTAEEELRKEAMKVLCNMIYNSTWVQERLSTLRILSGLTERLTKSAYCLPPSSVQFYELRLMFLMTALRPELRVQLQQAGGVSILTATLEHCLEIEWKNQYEAVLGPAVAPVSFEASQRAVEILKILFNITHSAHSQELDEENADLYRHLVAVLRICMMRRCELTDDTDELQGHTVNLLSAVPLQCLDVLLSIPVAPDSQQSEGVNMDCVHLLLKFMESRLKLEDKMKENLTPVLNLLIESCRAHRETRRYVRNHILPPLRDVSVRPEEGYTVKSRLIRLMTHVDTDLKHCAADLIFVLCKENVSRFVKYTGYGNAAGLLATRGLLGGEGPKGSSSTAQYSSDSDSDTEEYRQVKGRINQVTGRVEVEQPNPMEGMTEEEKEEEAQRLVTLFSKLSRENIIQPMGLDAEGKLVPMSGLRNTLLAEEEESGADSDTEADDGQQE